MKLEMITIPKERYEKLIEDRLFLSCLEGAGVDSWDGYDDACTFFREELELKNKETI